MKLYRQSYFSPFFAMLVILTAILVNYEVVLGQTAGGSKKSIPSALAPSAATLEYQVSMRDAGWMGWTSGGMMSGMLDRNLKIDALQVRLNDAPTSGVWYAVCTEDGIWQNWMRNGETSGKQNQASVQAIALRVYNMPTMGIEYRVHITGGEWLAWTSNGDIAGMIGQGKTLDAVEIRLQQNAPPEASLIDEIPPPTPSAAAQAVSQVVASSSKKKTSDASQDKTPALSANNKIESFKIQEDPPPQPKTTPVSASKKESSAPAATSSNNQANTAQTGNNQTDWGGVANTAGQVAGQALNGVNSGMNSGAGNNSANRINTQPSNNSNSQYNSNNQPNQTGWSNWVNQPMQRASGTERTEKPVFVPIASRKIALQANNNRYLSAMNDPRAGALFVAVPSTIAETETFELAFLGEHRVALKTLNGRYLSLRQVNGGNSLIAPTAELISTNEAFEIVSAGAADRVAFRAANGQYLSVEEFGQYRLFGKETVAASAWEQFRVTYPDGKPLLQEASQQSSWRTGDAADRIIVLVANPTTGVSNQGSATQAMGEIVTTTPAKVNAATTEKPTTKVLADPKTYLSGIELDIVQEINLARTKPSEYAAIMEGYRKFYKGKTLAVPAQSSLTTKEGVKALDEAILALKMARAAEALTPLHSLTKAARDHVDNTGPRGTVGHVGTDKSNPNDRAARYGNGIVNENICYGRSTARDVVIRLLIDDGTSDRGYRKNIMNPAFKFVGTAFGLHKTQKTMCSQVFAATFEDK